MLGSHCIRHWSTTQTTISLSSGEAELHGIAKGISHAIGMQSISRDLGWHYNLRVHSDAAAAIGIARRRGLDKYVTWTSGPMGAGQGTRKGGRTGEGAWVG